jgi:3-hydroxyisobutyrate dehydrogenase-like beta-hydroxyacid dehydrogenase
MKIGFIGLGTMGAPMAGHLLVPGHELVVYARRRETATALLDSGAIWADDPKTLAAQCELVFTCLPGPAEIEAIYRGPNGLMAGLRPGTAAIDCSTGAPSAVRALAADLAAIDVTFMDAPVSGGPKGATSGKLAIWVGGPADAYDRYKPVLELMGDQVRYIGEVGTASVAKLVHNCANYGIQMILAEVFTLGVKAGLDPAALWSAVRQGSLGRQRAVDRLADQFLPADFDHPTFVLDGAHKDVALATQLARETGVPMRFANLTFAEMTEAVNRGWGRRDSRATMLLQEQRAGVDIKVPRETLQAILRDEPLG